jgi:hypothetical protein
MAAESVEQTDEYYARELDVHDVYKDNEIDAIKPHLQKM